MRRVFCAYRICKELQKRFLGSHLEKKLGIASPPKLSPKTRLPTPSKDGGKARGAGLFGGAFLGAHSRMPGAGGSESARNCREAFRCRWWDFGSYTLFKDPEFQLLPITALTCSRTCGFRARVPGALRVVLPLVLVPWCWCRGAGAVVLELWCWCCGAGAGAVVLVLWCWCCGVGAA